MSAIDHATFLDVQAIAAALRARRTGSGWIARCPAHRDNTPSLSIHSKNDRVLVHCHAGCPQDAVIAALRQRGLWSEERFPRRRAVALDPERTEQLILAKYWRQAAIALIDELLATLPETHPERMGLTALLRRLEWGDDVLLTEYRAWRAKDPELTWAMVCAGRLHNAKLQRDLMRLITRKNDAG